MLAPEWQAWLVDNALAGEPTAALEDALVSGGIARKRAREEIAALFGSPVFARCLAEKRRADRLEMVARLLRTAQAAAPIAREVERRQGLSADELLGRYVASSRPVVLVDALTHWPARAWTWAGLSRDFGDVSVELMEGDLRSRAARDRRGQPRREMRFGAFVDGLTEQGEPPPLSLEAYNHGFANPGLAPLLDDVVLDEILFDPARKAGGVSLWITPRETFTPLHFDIVDNLFCQVIGRKRLSLVSPLATSLLTDVHGMWAAAPVDELLGMEAHADVGPLLQTCELGPGDALYLPAGTWHEVTTCEHALHLSVMAFRHARDLSFYAPATR